MNDGIVILLGGPCSGKGTQSRKLSEKGLKHISAGELLRIKYPIGTEIRERLDKGLLVSVDLMNKVMEEEMEKYNFEGILLDGYPRTLEQAKFLSSLKDRAKIKAIIVLEVKEEDLFQRMLGRKICSKCEGTFRNNHCECCDKQLVRRKDDNPDSFKIRYDTYKKDINNILLQLTGPVFFIDASLDEEEVFKKITECI